VIPSLQCRNDNFCKDSLGENFFHGGVTGGSVSTSGEWSQWDVRSNPARMLVLKKFGTH
jgi:hypothetical protein